MKIRFKTSLIETLKDFNDKTEERENGWICQYFHSDYHIIYDDKDTIFEVLWLRIEDWKIAFICFRKAPDRFEFFSEEYFEIIDYRIPMIWGIGWFPKGYRFFYFDNTPDITEKSTYYWSLPMFYSSYFFLYDYYESPSATYQPIFDTYNQQLVESKNYRQFSKTEFKSYIDYIKQLP